MSEIERKGNFEAIDERGSDNFHTSIYEADYKGLLIARCNQNGRYPHQVTAMLNGLNGKQVSSELIAASQARIAQLEAEKEQLVADAIRYRFLRDPYQDVAKIIDKIAGHVPYDEGTQTGGHVIYEYRSGDDLDQSIDAARAALLAAGESQT